MNLKWRNTTKYDCLEFNKWSNKDNYKGESKRVLEGVVNINKYLNANRYGGFGVFVKQFLNCQNFGGDMYFVKTALDKTKIVGVVIAHKSKDDNVLECMAIAVNPKLRGKGYGTAMIFDVAKQHHLLFNLSQKCEISVLINKDNVASQTTFKNVGFVKTNGIFKKIEGVIPINEQYTIKPQIIIQSKAEVVKQEKQKHANNTNHIRNVITKSKENMEITR